MRGHANNKMGRNELCPCGSGKKYKRCCMEGIQAQDTLWQRVHAAFQVVQSQLMEFGLRQFGGLKEFAWSAYHFGDAPELADQSDQYVSVFGHYLLFRWRPHRKKLPTGDATIAQAYLRLHGSGLRKSTMSPFSRRSLDSRSHHKTTGATLGPPPDDVQTIVYS